MQARNGFEKEYFKLTNNSMFGKTIEDVPWHINVQLVTDEKKLKKRVAKPTCKFSKIFVGDDDNEEYMVALKMLPPRIILRKPVYTGFTLLYHFQ